MKAQISLEYVILIGMFFFMLIPILYYASSESVKAIQQSEAESVVNSIAKTADSIYALGPGSQNTIEITMPGGVDSVIISKNEILLKVRIYGGLADVFAETKANVTGTISITKGIHHITLKTLGSGVVQIED